MKIRIYLSLVLGLLTVGYFQPIHAEQIPAESFSELSLEDMLNTKITVVSKKSETISEAPGIVSVITAADINQMPYDTLNDILKTVPGVTITESFYGLTSVSIRGIKDTHYNNRTLLLVNGNAIRNVVTGTYWLEVVPVNVIERIEIIRGPGSVLYGTGAFSGVINIITKSDQNITEITAAGGSKSAAKADVTFGRKNENTSYMAGLSYNYSKGYEALVRDEAKVTAQLGRAKGNQDNYRDNYGNFFGNINLQGMNVDAFYMDQIKDKFGVKRRQKQAESLFEETKI
jgi:outer membrane receptor for ferrienterochelin and colicins